MQGHPGHPRRRPGGDGRVCRGTGPRRRSDRRRPGGREHYEIARYGALRSWAELAALDDAADLLDATLLEEKETDAAAEQAGRGAGQRGKRLSRDISRAVNGASPKEISTSIRIYSNPWPARFASDRLLHRPPICAPTCRTCSPKTRHGTPWMERVRPVVAELAQSNPHSTKVFDFLLYACAGCATLGQPTPGCVVGRCAGQPPRRKYGVRDRAAWQLDPGDRASPGTNPDGERTGSRPEY